MTQPPPISRRVPSTTLVAIFILLGSVLMLALVVVGAVLQLRIGEQNQQFEDLAQEQRQQMAGEQQQAAIQSVMLQTKTVFQQFASRLELSSAERKPLGPNCDQVTQAMMAIDLSDCPEDFQEKYAAVIKAWQDVSAAARRGTGELGISGGTIFDGIHLDFRLPSGGVGAVNEAVRRFQGACLDLARCAREDGGE